ncbi:MAG: fused MFS/spermidine synthase [Thermoguttaceae bacterium]
MKQGSQRTQSSQGIGGSQTKGGFSQRGTGSESPGIARLGLVSFLCGCMVMVLEMTGSRMLAPYLGTSVIVWTSLIGIVLASLSVGYWFGGIIADHCPKPELLARIVFAAAIVVAVIGGGYTFILDPLSSGNINLYLAAVLASVILFSIPAALLGAVSPFIAKLAVSDVASTGTIVGRLYALSSIGSILGTFLGGFVLIAVFKTGTILFLIAVVLALSSLLLIGFSANRPKSIWTVTSSLCESPAISDSGSLTSKISNRPEYHTKDKRDTRDKNDHGQGRNTSTQERNSNIQERNRPSEERNGDIERKETRHKEMRLILVFIPVFLIGSVWYHVQGDSLLPTGLHWDTPYNHIKVYDSYNGSLRSLQTDPGGTAQSHMLIANPDYLVSQYLTFHNLAFFLEPTLKNVLVIGGGGYAFPKHILAEHPDVHVDVVEIDPGITAVAREYFGLKDDPRLQVFHEDARRFLRRKEKEVATDTKDRVKYDLIFGDAFNSHYNIPFHLTTKEYMQEVARELSDRGIFMTNIIASVSGQKQQLFQGFYHALTSVFPTVEVFLVQDPNDPELVQNIILIGYKSVPDWDNHSVSNAEQTFNVNSNPSQTVDQTIGHTIPDEIRQLRLRRWTEPIAKNTPPLTDQFAPVEYYTLQ